MLNNRINLLLILSLIACVITPCVVLARVRLLSQQEMIKDSEIIAVVDISKVRQYPIECPNTYGQAGSASIVNVLKGNCPSPLTIYGGKQFHACNFSLHSGRFLVFLKRDQRGRLVGVNWHLSACPIKGDLLEYWYSGSDIPLARVLQDVKTEITRQATNSSNSQNNREK